MRAARAPPAKDVYKRQPAEAVNLLAQIAAPRVHIGLGIERIDNAEHLLRPRHKLHEPLCALLRFSDGFEIGLHLSLIHI